MSAIFGMLRFDDGEADRRALERMSRLLAHRGPDGATLSVHGPIGLGHRLMRVNREDIHEAQPLYCDEADLTLVADLRLDNRAELAAAFDIEAARLQLMPDSALVMLAYRRWGADCARHLLGDFAFALWDGRARRLVLARDHMGQRSLFYHRGGDFIAFASEIKALWAVPDVPRTLCDDELGRFLLMMPDNRPPGGTLYTDILGLLGGASLIVERDGDARLDRYWQPGPNPQHENRDVSYYVEAYRAVLAEAVNCRVARLTAPPSLMLSAGFDSAAIAGLAGPALAAQQRRLIGFSIVVPEAYRGTPLDIRPQAEQCRRAMPHLDLRYIDWYEVSPLIDVEQHFLLADGPVPPNHGVMDRLHAQAAAAGSRLMMDGIGGDYTLNPRGTAMLAWLLRHRQWRRFAAEFRAYRRLTGRGLWSTLRADVVAPLLPERLTARFRRWRWRYAVDAKDVVVDPAFLHGLRARGAIAATRRNAAIPATAMRARLIEGAARVAGGSAAGGGAFPAAFGLDLTRPFHDKRVVELALAIPEHLYVREGRNRYLACRALADIYPPEFQTRGRGNEALTPNIPAELEPIMPVLAAEAARLESNDRLSARLDLGLAAQLLAQPTTRLSRAGRARQMMAYRAVTTARFVEWFERGMRND